MDISLVNLQHLQKWKPMTLESLPWKYLSVYVGDNFQVIKINKTFYENQNELNHILEQTSIENLTNSSRIVETSNNITYYQITDENNIIGFENETYIAINNNNPSNIIIIGSYDLDLLKQITPTIKNK